MNTTTKCVIDSYHRARETGRLFDTFYDRFLAKSPEIERMFVRTDFHRQKLMLRESILEMLQFANTGEHRDEIVKLGDRHRVLDVRPAHFQMWLDSLCEALAEHDPEFNADLEAQWRSTMRDGIAVMTER